MVAAGDNLPVSWDLLLEDSAILLARFIADRERVLRPAQVAMLVGIGGVLVRQQADLLRARAVMKQMQNPEGSA